MKRAFVGSLVAVLMSASLAPIASAQTSTTIDSSFPMTAAAARMDVTPFNLVFLAYQGFFEEEGIPMAGGLIDRYESGGVTAQDLVQVAINMNRLSPDKLNDDGYLRSVDYQLEFLTDTSN